jgi:signal transduction histidine kinase
LIAYAASRRFARPLEELSDAAERLSKGDLSTRVELKGAFPEMQITADTLNQVAESLERLERERRQMIADIAHELRNPLTAMHTRLEGLEDGFVEFSPKEVQRLQAQVSLLSRLVEDLRTLSLADAGQLSLHLREVDLQDWLVGVVEQFRPRAREKNITLAFVPPASRLPPPALSADPDRLAQVMNNLLDNALRYTPQSGSIEVGLDYAANGARVWVQDSGPGIPSEALPEIFGRFYRADASRSRLSGGSGLGLAIAKALVELHQGRIEASNRTTGGARFLFELAIKQ